MIVRGWERGEMTWMVPETLADSYRLYQKMDFK